MSHFTTGNSLLDVILSAGGTAISTVGAYALNSADIPLWQKEVAWAIAVIAGVLTIVNTIHLVYVRIKQSKQ